MAITINTASTILSSFSLKIYLCKEQDNDIDLTNIQRTKHYKILHVHKQQNKRLHYKFTTRFILSVSSKKTHFRNSNHRPRLECLGRCYIKPNCSWTKTMKLHYRFTIQILKWSYCLIVQPCLIVQSDNLNYSGHPDHNTTEREIRS